MLPLRIRLRSWINFHLELHQPIRLSWVIFLSPPQLIRFSQTIRPPNEGLFSIVHDRFLAYGLDPELDLQRFSKTPLRSQSTGSGSATMTPPPPANTCGLESYSGVKHDPDAWSTFLVRKQFPRNPLASLLRKYDEQ